VPASRAAAAALALLLLVFARAGVPAPAAAAPREEKPLPAFEGTTLDGKRLSIAELLGKRLLVLFVQPGAPDAAAIVAAARAVSPARSASHFEIVAIARGTDETALRALPLDFQVLRDPQGAYGAQLGLRSTSAAVLVDAEGYVVRGTEYGGVPAQALSGVAEGDFREWLRLPAGEAAGPDVEERPAAPAFVAQSLSGAEKLDSASLRGKPAVLIFFLHTCPHCHHALEAMKGQLAALPEAKRPQLVAVSIVARQSDVEEALKEAKLDFFPVWTDGDEKIRAAYGALTGVPVIFGIDAAGRIQWRVDGWRDDRDPPLMKMRLAILAGEKAPMLLHSTGYSGDEFCATCHASQHDTWLTTKHADAFDTLVRHGADRNAECVGCHVVGFGKPGGYDLAKPAAELEGVGCETCHGRGGPHLSPGAAPGGNYAATCLACHDPKHSLGFDYATFLPRVSHAANAALASLPAEERRKRLVEQRARRDALLPTRAAYVGSDACKSCHTAEHAKWAVHPHASALTTLAHAGKADDTTCVGCHTTGYGKGGFPAGGKPAEHAAFAGVGCESCHGPGGDHVKADAPKKGTIVSLADKCDSCVILQVCGSCHDPANDPGFEYEVKDKIQAQRHSDRPLGTGAAEASR
jgi:peroxiredoxin